MALTLKLEIATPEGTVYSEDVELVTLPVCSARSPYAHKKVQLSRGTLHVNCHLPAAT
jgi:hypothetical protein